MVLGSVLDCTAHLLVLIHLRDISFILFENGCAALWLHRRRIYGGRGGGAAVKYIVDDALCRILYEIGYHDLLVAQQSVDVPPEQLTSRLPYEAVNIFSVR
jgi:hypothetical protein